MDCNMPGFPVLHHLLEIAQTHVHWVGDAMQSSHPLSSPYPAFNLSQNQGLFPWVGSSHQMDQSIGASVSALYLPVKNQGWFPLGLTSLISCCPRNSQESSPASKLKIFNSSALSLFHGPTLTSIPDYWKNQFWLYGPLPEKYVSIFWILSRFIIAFLPGSKCLQISWLQSLSAVILKPKKITCHSFHTPPPSFCHEVMGPYAMILVSFLVYMRTHKNMRLKEVTKVDCFYTL